MGDGSLEKFEPAVVIAVISDARRARPAPRGPGNGEKTKFPENRRLVPISFHSHAFVSSSMESVVVVILTLMLGAFLIWLFVKSAKPSGQRKAKASMLSKTTLAEHEELLKELDAGARKQTVEDEEEEEEVGLSSESDNSENCEFEMEANDKKPAMREGLRDTPVRKWSVNQVALFLEALEMVDYIPAFVKAGVNGVF